MFAFFPDDVVIILLLLFIQGLPFVVTESAVFWEIKMFQFYYTWYRDPQTRAVINKFDEMK